jgi:hypothetical protein
MVREREPSALTTLRQPARPTEAQAMDVCTVALWRLQHDDVSGLDGFASVLRSFPNALNSSRSSFIAICRALVDARLAVRLRRPNASVATAYLDSLMRSGPASNPYIIFAANMSLAQIFESRKEPARALDAIRRRPYVFGPWGAEGLSSMLREEGRLASLTGDTAGAIHAYSHYLALRAHAEPGLAAAVATTREALNRLLAAEESRR